MPTFKRADQEQMEKAQDLLDAGPQKELGFAKQLFFGRLKLDDVLPYPKQDPEEKLRTDELIAKVDHFFKTEVDPAKIDRDEEIPRSVITGLGQLGVMGMTVPKEYGGGGFSHTAYCRTLEHVARYCASTAVVVGAHQSIGLKALMLMGKEEHKRRFLPKLASGELVAAFCLSEPEVGSDAANVQTRARLSDDGTEWIINGEKKFATNAAIAGMMTVMAKTPITDDKGKTKDKVTAFLVTPDLPGFEIVSPNRSKCGVRGTWQATLRFNDMRVPREQILGEVGKGLRVALGVLDYGRCTLSAGCVGGAKVAMASAIERAKSRRQFDRSISEFQLIREKIARMAQTTFAMDAVTYMAAGLVDKHLHGGGGTGAHDIMLETAMVKLFCSESLWQIADDTVQIWGGEGYMRDRGIERMLRDARINRIVEGATEVMTAFIALIGMKGVGEQFEQVLRMTKHPVGNFGRLASFARDQFRDVVVGHDFDSGMLHHELEQEGHTLARLTNQLARKVAKLLATYKQDILDMQLIQQRVAWSAVNLYAMAAVISKLQSMLESYKDDGNGHAAQMKHDLLIGKAFCHRAAAETVGHLSSLFRNSDKETLAVADAVLGK